MADLHSQDFKIKFKQGLAANISATATVNQTVEGEPHYATDTKALYIFDGTDNVLANTGSFVLKAGDTMTGLLTIDLGSDTVGLDIQADASQTANLVTIKKSDGTV